MKGKQLFAVALGFIVIGLSAAVSRAQDDSDSQTENRSDTIEVSKQPTRPRLVSDPVIVSEAPALPERSVSKPAITARPLSGRPTPFNQMLLSAIDARLGSPYVYGSEGPNTFDCSGFVWSVYKELGVDFERGSARSLWVRMEPVSEDEQYQFGNLVFFSGLTHVGIVADANGFYHASRSHGVVYSPFNKYWLERVDGFRRVNGPATAKLGKH